MVPDDGHSIMCKFISHVGQGKSGHDSAASFDSVWFKASRAFLSEVRWQGKHELYSSRCSGAVVIFIRCFAGGGKYEFSFPT